MYKELKNLVRFFRTSAGQKWSHDYLPVMIETAMAAKQIQDLYDQQNKK
jgi:hypothetical protein